MKFKEITICPEENETWVLKKTRMVQTASNEQRAGRYLRKSEVAKFFATKQAPTITVRYLPKSEMSQAPIDWEVDWSQEDVQVGCKKFSSSILRKIRKWAFA